jgi:formate C-acetyltransferase
MQKITRNKMIDTIRNLSLGDRIHSLKTKMVEEPRYLSLEQALIVTECYKANEDKPVPIRRAMALASALEKMAIQIDHEELIVGNRTAGVRSGVVSPDAGISWINREIEHLHDRPQDRFKVRPADIAKFREIILPYWKGKSLEDVIYTTIGDEISAIGKVAKINQKDHAQGHICPDTEKWLTLGPSGILLESEKAAKNASPDKKDFYNAVDIVLNGAILFIIRYADKADFMADIESNVDFKKNLREIAKVCRKLAVQPPETFREALQSLWFLYVILQMESNASSFSPGRADQYLYPYWKNEMDKGTMDFEGSLELIEALWLKFNQIVYLRNSGSAKYFAGFPIGFNIALGGQNLDGTDASNELSFLFLKAQELIGLPQPNLSARLFAGSPQDLVEECSRVIGKGSGMPQILNDESIIPALMNQGIEKNDAINYAIVGCVELSTHGNNLGWSDAAMFNLNKALELTMNHGKCLLSHDSIGPDLGGLDTYWKTPSRDNWTTSSTE